MRLPLIACAIAAAACGSTPTPNVAATPLAIAVPAASTTSASPTAPPDAGTATAESKEDRRIAHMLKRVVEARGLAATKPVPGVVLDRDALIGKVKAHVAIEVPPEAIVHEGLELKMLGFVDPSMDYLGETFKLLEAQLAGFYEPTDGTMYMAGDLDGENAQATLAHELDHALQDQHYDLKPHSKYVPGQSDAQLAFSALAEGDATSTMADVLMAKAQPGKTALDLPDDVFAEQVLESVSSGPTADAPHIMRTSLVAPYVYGTLFVNALRRRGGWSAVDEAWGALPTTTEQILHPDKWRAREAPLAVKAPTFAALGAGWSSTDEDSNGELGMRLAFEEWMGAERAARAAAGWGGDRAVLVQNGDTTAIAMHVRYDANATTHGPDGDPFALLAAGLANGVGKPAQRDASWVCVERAKLGPIGAMKKGRDLVIVAGPTRTGATWGSAGDCTLARRWATEIAASGG